MARQFVVVGLGNFGYSVAQTLAQKGCQVLAIDRDEEKVQDISSKVTNAVQADVTDEKTIHSLGLGDMDVAVVSVGEDLAASIMITLLLKKIGIKTVVTKAISTLHAEVLRKIGADRIIFPERDIGEKLAEGLVSPNILEYIELSPEHNIVEIIAPQSFVGQTLGELGIRAKYKVSIMAIKRKVPVLDEAGDSAFKEDIMIAPEADDEVEEGDILVIVGNNVNINKVKELK